MDSLFIFYILATAIILVQCQEYQHTETGPHDFVSVDCRDRASLADIRKNRKESSVMPRERHVTLISQPGFDFNPPTVSVKRCNGFCADRWSPMPTKTMDKEFIVHRHPERDPMNEQCVRVTVKEHMSCKCMCMRSAADCTNLQTWDPPSCACPCINRNVEEPRCKNAGRVWHDDTCTCRDR